MSADTKQNSGHAKLRIPQASEVTSCRLTLMHILTLGFMWGQIIDNFFYDRFLKSKK